MGIDLDKKIESWRKKLLDLSKRNRMINFRETKTKSLPLKGKEPEKLAKNLFKGEELYFRHAPEEEKSKEEQDTKKNEEKEEISDEHTDIKNDLSENEVVSTRPNDETENSLYKLFLKQRETVREKGVDTLYLALRMLHWYEAEQSEEAINSPLLFLPVNLQRETNRSPDRFNYYLEFKEDDVLLNPALQKKLEDEFGLTLPENEINLTESNEFFQNIEEAVEGFHRWEIKDETILGIFDFTKFAMYEDLEENKDQIRENPIVQAISDNPEALQNDDVEVPSSEELDEKTSPKDTFQVLDADSSQQHAIEAAKSGLSFVIQGPPGTGKSQTIANIIAEKLAKAEKVLFVSEKKAALDVVKKRLDEAKIGRFCLEIHGDKASKKDVLTQIEQEYNKNPVKSCEVRENKLEKLKEKRDKLNKYGNLIFSEAGKLSKTPYEIHGKLAVLDNVPKIEINIKNPLSVTEEEFKREIVKLKGLQDFPYEVNRFQDHPWKNTTIDSLDIDTPDKMRVSLEKQKDVVATIKEDWSKKLAKELELSIESVNDFVQSVKFLKHLDLKPDFQTTEEIFESAFYDQERQLEKLADLVRTWKNLKSNLNEKYSETIFSESGEYLRKEITGYGILRFFQPSYHNMKNRILEYTKQNYSPGFEQLKSDMKKLEQLQETKEELSEFEDLINDLHHLYKDKETNWNLVMDTAEWVKKFHSFGRFDKDKAIDLLIKDEKDLISNLKKRGNELLQNWENATEFFRENIETKKVMVDGYKLFEANFSHLQEYYSYLLEEIPRLRDWVQFTNKLDSIESNMTNSFIEKFFNQELDAEILVRTFEKAFYTGWLNKVYEENNLDQFNRNKYDRMLRDFKNLDQEQLKLSQIEIIHRVTQNRPTLDLEHNQTSEQAILKREMRKSSRHMPLRKLFRQTKNLVTKIKPCFMMSPLSVA